jgi:hypothetical protein
MAFALKIVVTLKNGEEEIEPAWWSKVDLQKNFNFKEEINHYYLDYVLYVNKSTFIEILKSQEHHRKDRFYNSQGWKEINNKTKEKIDEILLKLDDKSKIKIWIYEWESGLS